MQCQKLQRKLSAYLDGELDLGASQSIESHLNQCGACMEMVADFRRVDALVRGLPKLDAGPKSVAQLLKEAGESGATARRPRSDRFPFAPVLRVMSTFMDMIEERKTANPYTLDEFGDFPPCSIGHIYLKLLNQSVRG